MAQLDLREGRRAARPQPLAVSAPAPSQPFDAGTGQQVLQPRPPRTQDVPAGPMFPGPPRATQPAAVDASKLADFRKAADAARFYEDQTDTGVLADPRYAHFAQTGEYRPSTQAFPDAETAGANFGHRVPGLFDDPSTAQLEGHLNQQIAKLQQPNPQLNQLLEFLNSRFRQESQTPGYSPEELAVLRTQALEPVEDYRNASKQRALERAGARGMLPSSGLHELDLRDIDLAADRNRTVLDRDLAVNQIGERNRDLANALSFATLGFQIPDSAQRQNFGDILTRSRELYSLPRQAMADANSVVAGAPMPGDLFQQALQLFSAGENQSRYNQQQNDAFIEALGEVFGRMFG